ncbi:Tctex1 domain-containing protein 1-B [Exaiptasia diaphana]|nr:Tctex1 domain-containing protein 1-B [Exaiptasia diaphana]
MRIIRNKRQRLFRDLSLLTTETAREMTSLAASRKRSVTWNSLDPFFQQERRKEHLETSSINSLASGIAFFFDKSRPRSSTWHGGEDDEKAGFELDKTDCNSTANLKDFENDLEASEILRQIVSEELHKELDEKSYVNEDCVKQAAVITQAVETRVREITTKDTKVVAVAYIGEIRDQGIEITSQCLWDPESDSFATASFRNKSLFAVCTVFTVS